MDGPDSFQGEAFIDTGPGLGVVSPPRGEVFPWGMGEQGMEKVEGFFRIIRDFVEI